MREAVSRIGLAALLWALTVSGGCGASIFTTSQEIRIGEDFAREVDEQVPLLHDPLVTDYVDEIGQLLASHSQRPQIPYHFKIVDSDEVNAFALPGGVVYVNRGTLTTAATEAELAAVVAHEVGHVVARHGVEQLTKQLGFSLLTSLALGPNPGVWKEQAANLFGTLGLLHYGRKAELEADRLGIDEMYLAGYEPAAMPAFFEKLLEIQKRQPGKIEKLFSTHPPTQERIDRSREIIASLLPQPGLRQDAPRFHEIQARLRGGSR